MKRLAKWLILSLLLLIIVIGGYLTFFLDLNDFKKPIEDKVQQATGRELSIKGDITWSFYPNIGFKINQVTLANPKSLSSKPFIDINSVGVKVALLPLLSKELQIKGADINGVNINWINGEHGKNSLTGITSNSSNKKENKINDGTTKPSTSKPSPFKQLAISQVNINNIRFNVYEGHKLTANLLLDYFKLNGFEINKNTPFAFKLNSAANGNKISLNGQGSVNVASHLSAIKLLNTSLKANISGPNIPQKNLQAILDLNANVQLIKKQLQLKLTTISLADIAGNGDIDVNYGSKIPTINAALKFGDIDLTPWATASDNQPQEHKAEDQTLSTKDHRKTAKIANAKEAPDLSFLHTINAKLTLDIKSIQYQKIHTQNWLLNASVYQGTLKLERLSTNLYDGKLSVEGQLSQQKNQTSYSFKQRLDGVQIRPLLQDSANIGLLSGRASFDFNGNGNSLVPEKILNDIKGNGTFNISDGSLYGINIPQKIREIKAKLKNKEHQATESKKTDFSDLVGSLSLANGIISNPDLSMASPLVELTGNGSANLATKVLDYNLGIKGPARLRDDNHKDILRGITVPLKISGQFSAPHFSLDTHVLFKALAEQELKKVEKKLENKLKDKVKEQLGDKLKDKLKSKLGDTFEKLGIF